jgi:hypothetical protein
VAVHVATYVAHAECCIKQTYGRCIVAQRSREGTTIHDITGSRVCPYYEYEYSGLLLVKKCGMLVLVGGMCEDELYLGYWQS